MNKEAKKLKEQIRYLRGLLESIEDMKKGRVYKMDLSSP
jgi:hypothetical protein